MLFFHFTFLSLSSYNTFKTIDATTQRNKSLRTLAIFICNKRDFIKCGLKSCWNMKFIIKMMKWAIFPPKPTHSVSASVLIACCNKRWVHFSVLKSAVSKAQVYLMFGVSYMIKYMWLLCWYNAECIFMKNVSLYTIKYNLFGSVLMFCALGNSDLQGMHIFKICILWVKLKSSKLFPAQRKNQHSLHSFQTIRHQLI